MLQRGPGLLAQDTPKNAQLRIHHPRASKRPRPFGPGYILELHNRIKDIRLASKRPRPFGPGYAPFIDKKLLRYVLLQRGPGLLAQDTVCLGHDLAPFSGASKRPRPFGPGYFSKDAKDAKDD